MSTFRAFEGQIWSFQTRERETAQANAHMFPSGKARALLSTSSSTKSSSVSTETLGMITACAMGPWHASCHLRTKASSGGRSNTTVLQTTMEERQSTAVQGLYCNSQRRRVVETIERYLRGRPDHCTQFSSLYQNNKPFQSVPFLLRGNFSVDRCALLL